MVLNPWNIFYTLAVGFCWVYLFADQDTHNNLQINIIFTTEWRESYNLYDTIVYDLLPLFDTVLRIQHIPCICYRKLFDDAYYLFFSQPENVLL